MCSKVLIVGGSNSIKYTPYVLDYLTGKALVDRVPDNARSTRYTLERLDGWLGSGQWDVIHFNWGMHDLTRVDGASPQVPRREYEDNLHRLAGAVGASRRAARVGIRPCPCCPTASRNGGWKISGPTTGLRRGSWRFTMSPSTISLVLLPNDRTFSATTVFILPTRDTGCWEKRSGVK